MHSRNVFLTRKTNSTHKLAFTLIELLVVIAIIAILSVVVILTLNPAQLLMQSRDSNRVSDLSTLNTALGIYAVQTGGSFGSASTTYISIPDQAATSSQGDQCQGLGLPPLPTGTSYECASSSTYRLTNGSGWIPVNWSTIAGGSPLSELPIDPINTTSSGDYYAYIPGQSSANTYELLARFESQKYTSGGGTGTSDGGESGQYDEVGKDLTLALAMPEDLNRVSSTDYLSFDQTGLVGYWPLNEGGGSTAIDQSGNGNNGSWSGTQAGTSGYYSAGKIGSWAGAFDGSTTYASVAPVVPLATNPKSISLWFQTTQNGTGILIIQGNTNGGFPQFALVMNSSGYLTSSPGSGLDTITTANPVNNGTWHFAVLTYNGTTRSMYFDGSLVGSYNEALATNIGSDNKLDIGAYLGQASHFYFAGLIDDVRVYNRALSAQEIQAMYNGGI